MNCGIPGPWSINLSCPKDVTRSSWSHEKELKNRHSTADEWHKQEDLLKQKHTQWDVRAGQGQERDRAVSLGPVSSFCRQSLTRGKNAHYLRWGFLGSRVLHFFFLIWSGVFGHLCQPSWNSPVLSGFLWLCFGVLPGQASDLPCSWPWLPFCWFPGILLEPNCLHICVCVCMCVSLFLKILFVGGERESTRRGNRRQREREK